MDDQVRQLLQARRYEDALERMLDLYEQKVFRMAVAMLKDAGRAEEVTQDVFLKLWRALPDYDGRAAPSTWLYAIARNTCLSALRAESYRQTTPLEAVAEPAAPETSSATRGGQETLMTLTAQLSRLPAAQREAITLFYFEDRSVKEVARLLDVPENTVKSHLRRARQALGAMLDA